MLCLAREVDDLRFGPFALRYILEAVDGADNVPIAILDRFDVDERNAAQAVRSLNVDFLFAHGNTGAQHIGHGAFMVQEPAEPLVAPIKTYLTVELGNYVFHNARADQWGKLTDDDLDVIAGRQDELEGHLVQQRYGYAKDHAPALVFLMMGITRFFL
jgi:hypothetical protein